MKVFDHATKNLKNATKRRWANRIVLRVDHPDVLDFLSGREDARETSLFKTSIAATADFMEAYEKDEEYDLILPGQGRVLKRLRARKVMRRIAEQTLKTGEPEIFFIDQANETNPTPHLGAIEAADPCAGQPLLPYEGCNLGSIHLERHLEESEGEYRLNWSLLEKTVRTSVRFLDSVIDVNSFPISSTEIGFEGTRKIGLGVMGFGRTLFMLGIPYHTEKGIEVARAVMGFIQDVGHDESSRLAERKGVYAGWEGSQHAKRGKRMRNACITAVASSETLSAFARTSTGCEPESSLIRYARSRRGVFRPHVLDCVVEIAKREGFWREDLRYSIIENNGSVQGISAVPERWQEILVTASDVPLIWRVRMQAAFQEFTDSVASSPLTLPQATTIDELVEAYLLAYRLKCKRVDILI